MVCCCAMLCPVCSSSRILRSRPISVADLVRIILLGLLASESGIAREGGQEAYFCLASVFFFFECAFDDPHRYIRVYVCVSVQISVAFLCGEFARQKHAFGTLNSAVDRSREGRARERIKLLRNFLRINQFVWDLFRAAVMRACRESRTWRMARRRRGSVVAENYKKKPSET